MKTLDQRIEWIQQRISFGLNDAEKEYIKFQMKEAAIEVSRAALENAAKNVTMKTKSTSCTEWCGSNDCSPECANAREYQVIDLSSITDDSNIPKI